MDNLKEQYGKLKEECGVFGIIGSEPFNAAGYCSSALLSLQHRGQEGAGIAYFDETQLSYGETPQMSYIQNSQLLCHKNTGLVGDVFSKEVIDSFKNSFAVIGHVKYAAKGFNNAENTQPMTTNHSLLTFALAYNGSITNATKMRDFMINKSGKIFHTTNDSEILNKLIIDEFIKTNDIEKSVFSLLDVVEGAYSVVVITHNKMIALRDKNGFRPLCMGKKDDKIIFASESCALDSIGAKFVRDVKPGELISVDIKGNEKVLTHSLENIKRGLCIFELVYFARPDSFIDGQSVYKARIEMGRALARQRPTNADVVCGVPDSGIDAAYGFHLQSGIPYGQAFVKNRYVGRSFIVPDQLDRENIVSVKLTPLRASIEGKRVVLIDDSIVRGTTSAGIIKALKNAGAREVHLRISSPPFKHVCHFGTDIDSEENLIANKLTLEGIREKIGADSLEFLKLESLLDIKADNNIKYCDGCFTGTYPINVKNEKE